MTSWPRKKSYQKSDLVKRDFPLERIVMMDPVELDYCLEHVDYELRARAGTAVYVRIEDAREVSAEWLGDALKKAFAAYLGYDDEQIREVIP